MKYLTNIKKRTGKVHYWLGADTTCGMWSTGGMNQGRKGWAVVDEKFGREICHMCRVVAGELKSASPEEGQDPSRQAPDPTGQASMQNLW